MKKLSSFILLIFILLPVLALSGCTLNLGKTTGSIVFQAADDSGYPLPELVVLDAGGKEQQRIALPDDTQRLLALNVPFSRYAIYQDIYENERWFRVDTQTGEYTAYSDFTPEGESPYICGYSNRWVTFCSETGVYLLNDETGEMSTLPIEIDPEKTTSLVFIYATSPDASAFVVWVQSLLWLVQMDAPQNAHLLGGEGSGTTGAPYFADDSKSILYTRRTDSSISQVIREKLDGSGSEILLEGEDILWGALIPNQEKMILVRKDTVGLVSLKDKSEETVFTPEDYVRLIVFNPDGKKAAIEWGGLVTDTVQWSYIDLKTKDVTALDDLAGLNQMYHPNDTRWLYVTNMIAENGGSSFYGLDLDDGTVREHLYLEEASGAQFYNSTTDGKSVLIYGYTDAGMQFWLIQGDKENAIQLTNADMTGASLSPDGKWVVVGAVQESEDLQMPLIMLIETATGEEKQVGQGLSPVWVNP